MKYKYEAFKDWKELFQWCADQKPLCSKSTIYYPCPTIKGYEIGFHRILADYKKAIPIREEEFSFYVSFFKDDLPRIADSENSFKDDKSLMKTEKFTTMLEVEE